MARPAVTKKKKSPYANEVSELKKKLQRVTEQLEYRERELVEATEQQAATSETLRVISSSPNGLQSVLDRVAESAARLCDTNDAAIFCVEEGMLRLVARFGSFPVSSSIGLIPANRDTVTGRAMVERQTIHVHDLQARLDEFPESTIRLAALERTTVHIADLLSDPTFAPKPRELYEKEDVRTVLSVPMLREDKLIGVITTWRREVRPFSDKQVALVKTFADQAVIAIDNVRLFQELERKTADLENSNYELRETLKQQTATSEILGLIASSPTDIQPVLNAMAINAARLCDATDAQIRLVEGDGTRLVASFGTGSAPDFSRNTIGSPAGRAILNRETVHVNDMVEAIRTEYPDITEMQTRRTGTRTFLSTPMLREGIPIGLINIRRTEVRPFTDKQIALLQTFADQAVIAIENVRLFKELGARTHELVQSVSELRALGEVGQAVSSTLDLQTVLSTIVRHAVQLSRTDGGVVYEYDEAAEEFHLRANHLMEAEVVEALQATPVRPGQGATGRAATLCAPVQLPDILNEREFTGTKVRPIFTRLGYRSVLAVPLLREGRIMGALTVYRKQAGGFSPEAVQLLQTFATQSALAIQNARLFSEIDEKGRQIEAANRHKSEFLANMSHELRTPLNGILGLTEMILDKIYGELPEKIRSALEDVQASGRHLLGLINDVLDLSKIEAGRATLSLQEYSMREVVQAVFTTMQPLAAAKNLALKIAVPADLPSGKGDQRRITQVLMNLTGNAIKFADSGEVRVEAKAAHDSFLVSVSDTGPGVALADQQRIFEEFQQVDGSSSRAKGGTGLGLAIAKRIIEMHRGHIWVESKVGVGSTFTFSLPVRVERQAEVS